MYMYIINTYDVQHQRQPQPSLYQEDMDAKEAGSQVAYIKIAWMDYDFTRQWYAYVNCVQGEQEHGKVEKAKAGSAKGLPW